MPLNLLLPPSHSTLLSLPAMEIWTFPRQGLTARHRCCAGPSPHGSTEGLQAVQGCRVYLFLQPLMMERLCLPDKPS